MAYSTQAQVQEAAGGAPRLLQLTDWDGTGQVDATRVTSAIKSADATIDSYIGRRLKTAVADGGVPDAVQELSAELAALKLKERRGQFSADDERALGVLLERLGAMARGGLAVGRSSDDLEASAGVVAKKLKAATPGSREKTKGFW